MHYSLYCGHVCVNLFGCVSLTFTCSNQQRAIQMGNIYQDDPVYAVVCVSKGQNECLMHAGNTVTNSGDAQWNNAPHEYSEVTTMHATTQGIFIQSEYSMAVSAEDTEQYPSEYSMVENVYSIPEGEQPEYAVPIINKSKKHLPPENKESPPEPANGTEKWNASPGQKELSPSGEAMPVYAQPDLSKKKKPHSPRLNNLDESPPPIPPRAGVL